MVDLAQRQPVGHGRDAGVLPVRDDVRGVEQRPVPQQAHRARGPVCLDDALPEHGLVKALLDDPLGVAPLDRADLAPVHQLAQILLRRDRDLQPLRLVRDDPHREHRHVQPLLYAHEPDQRDLRLVRTPQPDIGVPVRAVPSYLYRSRPSAPSASSYGARRRSEV